MQPVRLQSRASVESPGQLWEPPTSGLLHARARNSAPLPQETVHGDHSPHACHSVAMVSTKKYVRISYAIVGMHSTWTVRQYAIVDFRGLPWTRCTTTKDRFTARPSSHFGAEVASCRTLGPLTPLLPFTVNSWEIWYIRWEWKIGGGVGMSPWHVFNVHSLASVAFPGHVSLSPKRGLLHCRARNLVPRPQEDVHWVQEPHSSHSAASSEICDFSKWKLWKEYITYALRHEATFSLRWIPPTSPDTPAGSYLKSLTARLRTLGPCQPFLPSKCHPWKKWIKKCNL